MTTTTFVNGTVIQPAWLNDVNSGIYSGKVNATDNSTTGTSTTFQIHRNANYIGGTPGYVNAAIWGDTTTGPSTTSFEWAGLFTMNNYSTFGQNVGAYFQGNRYATGPTWGATVEVVDKNGTNNPTSGAVAIEVDVSADGTDTNNTRVGIDMVYRRQSGFSGLPMECGFGLRFQNGGDTSAVLKTAISFTGNIGIGLDFTGATTSANAIRLKDGQNIQFGQTGGSSTVRQLFYSVDGLYLSDTASHNYWAFHDNGSLLANGIQLLGAQQTITGSRGGNTALASLLTKLTLHGLIIDSTTA